MMYPQIFEDGSVNDFQAGTSYSVKVSYSSTSSGYVKVRNILSHMEWLEKKLGESLVWTSEIVVPRALLAVRQEGDGSGVVNFDWNVAFGQHPAYLRSVLVASAATRIPKSALSPAWQKLSYLSGLIEVPQGSVIARSSVHNISGQTSQLIAFRRDDGTYLPAKSKGVMHVVQATSDPLLYHAIVSDDLYESRHTERNIWVAALARVLEMIASEESSWDKFEYASVKETLRNVMDGRWKSWHDSNFDPIFAATLWEPFRPPSLGEYDE